MAAILSSDRVVLVEPGKVHTYADLKELAIDVVHRFGPDFLEKLVAECIAAADEVKNDERHVAPGLQ